jgi:hypothetical protein
MPECVWQTSSEGSSQRSGKELKRIVPDSFHPGIQGKQYSKKRSEVQRNGIFFEVCFTKIKNI